ncbi:MAG: ribosome biogenesis/translation initiation ATPase RLI [Candidatus Hodarchaeales archaeon]
MRIAIHDKDRCKPKKCGHECYKYCPGVRAGRETITFPKGRAEYPVISEALCSGSGICAKKCPFHAIKIVNTPEALDQDMTHRFGTNGFSLFRLPVVKENAVTGLVGNNGIGKSTALKILAGEIKPNLGDTDAPPDWDQLITKFRGSEIQHIFEKLANEEWNVARKPQYVDRIPEVAKGVVKEVIESVDQRGVHREIKETLALEKIWSRDLKHLSGGELQKVACAAAICRDVDTYLFDEPSSFLDVSERLRVARAIRALSESATVIVVEHDLAILDYLSDYVSIFYGIPAAYGIVSHPHGVREGINIYLDGYIPDENMRFRTESIVVDRTSIREDVGHGKAVLEYPTLRQVKGDFELHVQSGELRNGEVVGILGPNGIGKTTFVRILAGVDEPVEGELPLDDMLKVAYKPQYLTPPQDTTAWEFLLKINPTMIASSWFNSEVLRPFNLEELKDQQLEELSGGELQKVAIAGALSQNATILLMDEPTAYLAIEERLLAAKIIRRMVQAREQSAFIVDHDIVFQDYVSDRLSVFVGEPGTQGTALSPAPLKNGMNRFLSNLDVTFRRDPSSGRPRVNKADSRLDKEQKAAGNYYYAEGN